MRICFIADSSSLHAQRIVSFSVRKGDDILVLSTSMYRSDIPGTKTIHLLDNNRPIFSSAYEDRRLDTGLKAHLKSLVPIWLKLLLIQIIRVSRLLPRYRFCTEEIRHFDPDVIYCFRSFPEGVLASYCHIRPLLLRTAGPDISKLPKYPVFRQLIRRALQSADLVVTESIWERDLLRKLCGSTVNAEVEILGVDTSLFQAAWSRETLRDKYDLPRDAFVVVSNRALEGHYNGWSLVEAVKLVLDQCPNLVLFYASPTKMGLRSRARAEVLAAQCPRIRFLDRRLPHHEVPSILGCADVYVSLASYDGIPNSVLEAMACGIVPIVAELPQLHEWIEHGRNGYFVPQRDIRGVASVLRTLYENRDMLPRMASRCVETIHESGSHELYMERTRDLLRRLSRPAKFSYHYPSNCIVPSNH
jgi:glycosyltransferase involved in cell wall biosynthesis